MAVCLLFCFLGAMEPPCCLSSLPLLIIALPFPLPSPITVSVRVWQATSRKPAWSASPSRRPFLKWYRGIAWEEVKDAPVKAMVASGSNARCRDFPGEYQYESPELCQTCARQPSAELVSKCIACASHPRVRGSDCW